MAAGRNLPQTDDGRLKLDLGTLTYIPEEIFDITDLEYLDVSSNKLTSLSESIDRLQKLKRLDAYNNELSTLPAGVEKLHKLTHLYIYENQLTDVPPGVCSLPNLEVLGVSKNKLSELPPGVERLQKLKQLGIDDNRITELPSGVCSLSNLEKLSVSNNKLSILPRGVEKLQKLRGLLIFNNQITEVPEGVCSLSSLEVLYASNNKLSKLPAGFGKLKNLRELDIQNNQLTELPQEVCALSSLEVLCVSNNKLSALPPGVEKLQKLRELYTEGNQLTEVPPGVCSLSNLAVLNVGRNPIRRLPDDVTRLTKLKTLSVQGCQFDEFPRQVLQLTGLEILYAGGCKFHTFPDEVGNLQHLRFLSLEANLLSTLPRTLSQLHNLREVHLDINKFDTFPEVLCELPAMEKLGIRKNNITRLPTALHRADKLKELDVSGNPLTYPPQDVCEEATSTILAFLKQEAKKDEQVLKSFNRLSLKVGPTQWKPIARSLGLSNTDIDNIKATIPDDLPDQVYQTLVTWREREGDAATLSALELHLRDLDFQQLAGLLSQTPKRLERRGHEPDESGAVGGEDSDEPQNRYPSVTVDQKFPIIEFERLEFPEQSILGLGGFASVQKAYHRDWRQYVAVKRLLARKVEGSEQDILYSEARKLNLGSRSDHVIGLLGVCLEPHFAIVMQFMQNGSLAGLLQDVDVPWAMRWRMAHEISLGMTFLHCQDPQILHCDLKAENVLLDEDFHVKISDFGLSKWKTKSRVVTSTSLEGGTITHVPPEYFSDINFLPTARFDVYSFGVLLWEILTRAEPYEHAMNSALIRLGVTSGQRPDMTLVPTDPPEVDTVSRLMQTCWSQDPDDRPAFQDCADQLHAVSSRSSKENILEAIIYVQKEKMQQRA